MKSTKRSRVIMEVGGLKITEADALKVCVSQPPQRTSDAARKGLEAIYRAYSTPVAPNAVGTTKALLGAYRKGRQAAAGGGRIRNCPYHDDRGGYHNNVTFSRAFQKIWIEGFNDEKAGRPEQYTLRPPRS